jgi:glucose-1-phosphate cytidylyltransferase
MIERFKKSGKAACFIAVRPPFNFHIVDFDKENSIRRIHASQETDIWINGGYFIFSNRVFDYIREGEELVLEPFQRMIEANDLMAYKYEGFWRAMDTLRDKQMLEDMVEKGSMPWRVQEQNGEKHTPRCRCASVPPAAGCPCCASVRTAMTSKSASAEPCSDGSRRGSISM